MEFLVALPFLILFAAFLIIPKWAIREQARKGDVEGLRDSLRARGSVFTFLGLVGGVIFALNQSWWWTLILLGVGILGFFEARNPDPEGYIKTFSSKTDKDRTTSNK